VVAREAEGAERVELWGRAVEFYPGYAPYQKEARGSAPDSRDGLISHSVPEVISAGRPRTTMP
jgi:hypothetical protein